MKIFFNKIIHFLLIGTLMTSCLHEENKILKQDQEFLELAFKLAQESREKGSHPFGAFLVFKNKIFLRGHNEVNKHNNPMKHAEIVLLENYNTYKNSNLEQRLIMSPEFGGELPEIKDCQIFTSTQPCQMCEGAIYTMKVGKNLSDKPQVIFGLDKENLSMIVRGHKHHSRGVKVSGPFLLEQAKVPHADFWETAS